jgi:uncharacterized tellurite resistance protein B-like protein
MFGNWLNRAATVKEPGGAEEFENAIRSEFATADAETVLVVTAIVGLLGAVAYADGVFSPDEQQRVREELSRIRGMTAQGVDTITRALMNHILEIATVQSPHYTRLLRELGDQELRLDVLEMLVALAAADQVITSAETNVMRQITTSLGLTQRDYNAAQAKYKDRLSVLQNGVK